MEKMNVEVFCNTPNNGNLTLIFTDKGTLISSKCKKDDAYNGLIFAAADLLTDIAEMLAENIVETVEGDDEEKKAKAMAIAMAEVRDSFTSSLTEAMKIEASKRTLVDTGLPETLASILAEGMVKFPGKFETVGNPDCDEEKEDDSDDAYNLD